MAINNFNVGVGTTSQLTRYRYVATGGETSVSGTDADGKTLSYTVGLEQVFLNGVNLVRGQDYTATNGTSVGSLTALVASDVVEVFAFVPFNIANALTVSTVDAKGDLLVGTGADAVGRLAVGTNGQLLSAASGETSGLKWANGGLTLIKTETFSAVASTSVNDVFSATYENYKVVWAVNGSDTQDFFFRIRVGGADLTSSTYQQTQGSTSSSTSITLGNMESRGACGYFDILRPFSTDYTHLLARNSTLRSTGQWSQWTYAGAINNTTSYTGFTLFPTSGNLTGTIRVYGYNN